ncbi:flagellar hook basal body protein [Rheinheimera mesophila]|uniref:Flagellar hook-basal body complex protein FliE n=1 Tax=Rheinheimera mesophila TaxID=1547515 RepID=A0A3P3QGI6_9GAMM|nr:flagellar hook-basal body complex protein FliE [Rheinheimera mesophila]RRJ20231.1 flagellar hook basal body protein [Rheinheimera mesophila]
MISPLNTQNVLLSQFDQLQQIASNEQVIPAQNDSSVSGDFASALRSINAQQNLSSEMMAAVDAGRSDDLVGAMVASQKADLSFSMLLQIRNKVMNGVDDIMRMSL